jgi:hypothetical protein
VARDRRRRQVGLGLAMATALALGLAGWLLLRPDPREDAATDPRSAAQEVVMVQLRSAAGRGVAQALLAHDTAGTGSGAMLLVPSGLVVDAAGIGSMELGEVARVGAEGQSADALVDLLGVRVAGSWTIETAGLRSLVDSVEGVQVNVDAEIIRDGRVVIPPGARRLDGGAAVEYATYTAEGEPEQARLVRFQEVLTELLRRLPAERAAVQATVARTSADAPATVPSAQLAGLLVGLRGDVQREEMTYQALPVRPIDAGGGTESFGIDEAKASEVVAQLFPRALLNREQGQIRVLVQNGPRIPGLAEAARKTLVENNYRFISGGNSGEPMDASLVLISDSTPESRAEGEAIAQLLQLPPESLKVSTQSQTVADVIVVLGKDYKP